MKIFKQIQRFSAIIALLLFCCNGNAQAKHEKTLIGVWEIQGTLSGDDGEGVLMPHKPANPNCGTDYSVFTDNHIAKEVRYNKSCETSESTFRWKLDTNIITLYKDERSIKWLIHSIESGKMILGVKLRPGSEKRMYVVYKKRK